jgi:RNA polymerase sigma-32 factor
MVQSDVNSIYTGANQDYLRETMRVPMLSREHELELAIAWKEKQDVKAMHELVRAYGRLAVAMAAKFRHYGLPLGDLIQEGNIGLLQAAARFEPTREVRFSTYAAWWIRSAMQDYILRNWSIVRTGTTASQKSLFFNLRRLRARIAGTTGQTNLNEDSRKVIAKELGVPLHDVRNMEQRMAGGDQSLNAPLTADSEDDWQDFLVDERPNPEDVVISLKDTATRSKWLNHALGQLDPREQTIIKARQLQDREVTLEQLGKRLGVSKERVRQLEARAMGKLKAALLRVVGGRTELLLNKG